MAEQRTFNPWVQGSSPWRPTSKDTGQTSCLRCTCQPGCQQSSNASSNGAHRPSPRLAVLVTDLVLLLVVVAGLILGILPKCLSNTIGGFRVQGAAAFNRWVGWATIVAVPLAAAAVLLVLWPKITGTKDAPPREEARLEDELAAAAKAAAMSMVSYRRETTGMEYRPAQSHS